MQAAAELFPIRYVCAFGGDLPDGVVPLDDVFAPGHRDVVPPPARPGNAAAHVAVVTFDVGADGTRAVARNHMELIAGGLRSLSRKRRRAGRNDPVGNPARLVCRHRARP